MLSKMEEADTSTGDIQGVKGETFCPSFFASLGGRVFLFLQKLLLDFGRTNPLIPQTFALLVS
ncbi:MAG: hypothetical protein GY796_16760 [Chloroflexi bacterium]|nr:hypothetical protein [Chloroflexota bacterium]